MSDEPVPGAGAGEGNGELDLKGFHRAMARRTQERDAALRERDALKAQLQELAAYADDDDADDSPPVPRGNNAMREPSERDDGSAEYARRKLERLTGGDLGSSGWPV